MKPEYAEVPEALRRFNEGMTALFRAPKAPIKAAAPKPKPKRRAANKAK